MVLVCCTRQLWLLFVLLIHIHTSAAVKPQLTKVAENLNIFSNSLYNALSAVQNDANIIFSPISVQLSGVMLRIGAEGETAEQLHRNLNLVSSNTTEIIKSYSNLMNTYEKNNLVRIANKIYVMSGFRVQKDFNRVLNTKFYTTADEIDFGFSTTAANTINQWVESRTNKLITDIVSPSSLNSLTRIVLLNAIYFKGSWQHPFNKTQTKLSNFYLNEVESVQVPMMHIHKEFRYDTIPVLDATALELPYSNSSLSLLVLLPNSRTGLKNLEKNLPALRISELRLPKTDVEVFLPKFKAELKSELKPIFEKMGINRVFRYAQLGRMFDGAPNLAVSEIVHKAFIDVNEAGTVAAAASSAVTSVRTIKVLDGAPIFRVDRPFYYTIRNNDGIQLFTGRVVNLP